MRVCVSAWGGSSSSAPGRPSRGGFLPTDEFEQRRSSERGRGAILYAARDVERDPVARGISAHLLAIGSRPS